MRQISLFSDMPKYIMDTCSFSELKYRYSEDVFEEIWKQVLDEIEKGTIMSCEEVYEELEKQDDDFFARFSKYKYMFIDITDEIQEELITILKEHEKILDLKKKKSGADPFVIATAKAYKCTVVTEERRNNSPKSEKIPNVCDAYGIKCITFLDMLRELNIKV